MIISRQMGGRRNGLIKPGKSGGDLLESKNYRFQLPLQSCCGLGQIFGFCLFGFAAISRKLSLELYFVQWLVWQPFLFDKWSYQNYTFDFFKSEKTKLPFFDDNGNDLFYPKPLHSPLKHILNSPLLNLKTVISQLMASVQLWTVPFLLVVLFSSSFFAYLTW